MSYGLLYSLVLVHFLSDFILQSNNLFKKKDSSNKKTMLTANIYHSLIHSGISLFVLTYFCWNLSIFPAVLCIFISHLAVDLLKTHIVAKFPTWKYNIIVFVSDQLAHIISIAAVTHYVCSTKINPYFIELINLAKPFIQFDSKINTYNNRLILFLILMLIGLHGTGVFIRIFIQGIKYKPYSAATGNKVILINKSKENGIRDGGFIIGVLERMIVIFSVVTGMIQIIGFLIAVKSIARFKKFDDDDFVEYFIIGSFLSMFIAIIIGLAIKQLDIFPIELGLMNTQTALQY